MKDDSITKSDTIIPALGENNQEILDNLTYGLENTRDSKDLAFEHNINVMKNTEGMPDVVWPNVNTAKTQGMADGLIALETLGSSEYTKAIEEDK